MVVAPDRMITMLHSCTPSWFRTTADRLLKRTPTLIATLSVADTTSRIILPSTPRSRRTAATTATLAGTVTVAAIAMEVVIAEEVAMEAAAIVVVEAAAVAAETNK